MIKGPRELGRKEDGLAEKLKNWGMTALWVSWLFLLSPVVPGKEKPVRDLVGNLNPFSLPRASAGWDPLPNCFCVIIGTPAGELIHPQRSIDGTSISLPSTRWDERPKPNVFWLSTVPLCPHPPAEDNPGYYLSSCGQHSKDWVGAPQHQDSKTDQNCIAKALKTKAHISRPGPTC